MKKLITFLTVLLSCAVLFACTPQQQTPPDDKPDVPGTTGTFEYRALVRANDTIILSEVVSAIKNSSDKMLSVLNDTNTPIVGEIAFGDAERDYSAEAMDELDALVTASTYDCTSAYVIYKAKDGNVAVVWSDSLSQKRAINRFASDYSNVSVLADMTAGILASEVLDVDEYIIDATWGELKKKAPSEVVSALMSLADMYDGSAIVDWMANLWEPYICTCGNCLAEGK